MYALGLLITCAFGHLVVVPSGLTKLPYLMFAIIYLFFGNLVSILNYKAYAQLECFLFVLPLI